MIDLIVTPNPQTEKLTDVDFDNKPIFNNPPINNLVFCEPWIERKLRERLLEYKKKYPRFNDERVLRTVEAWDHKSQRWSPYMLDKDIKKINRLHHKLQSLNSLAKNEHL